jgi:DNA sulfur modification protein DndB
MPVAYIRSMPEANSQGKATPPSDAFAYVLLALRGTQSNREYYVAMCPLKLIPRLFLFDEDEIPGEMRAQRQLNRARVPEIARYITENPTEYVFSSLTVSIDGQVKFEALGVPGADGTVGHLTVPMSARFVINDGQHRRAGIEEALKIRPDLGDETISVVFFLDQGLKRCQQMFADLNKHAVRPTKSLGILYDLRDPQSQLARSLMTSVSVFNGQTETEKTTISNRSTKLFTLSSIYLATRALLNKNKHSPVELEEEKLAIAYWNEVAKYIPDWSLVQERKASAAEMRRDYIHTHGLALHALGRVGAALIAAEPKRWKEKLRRLSKIDWSRTNGDLWEGRATIGGRVSKAHNNVLLTTAVLKGVCGLPLSPEETKAEAAFRRRRK